MKTKKNELPKLAEIDYAGQGENHLEINVRYEGSNKWHTYDFNYVKHFEKIRHLLELQPDCNECAQFTTGNRLCKKGCKFVALKKEAVA